MNAQPDVSELDQLSWNLIEAKRMEDEARQHRLNCEEAVIALVGLATEGTQTVRTDYFKVSTVANLTRTLTKDGEDIIEKEGTAVMDQIIRYKPEVSVSGLKQLATSNPDAYQRVIKGIITKPAKPSVKVEMLGGA